MELVSIIIPLYNRESLITDTLRSIQSQSSNQWECIIVDDHSTDNSYNNAKDFIGDDKRFSIHKRPDDRPKGANACRNYGYEQSKGEYLNWFDSDDIMHPDFVSTKIHAIETNRKLDAVISKTAFFKDDIDQVLGKEKRTVLTENVLEDFMTLKVAWYLPDVMWKRTFLEGKTLFNENLLAGQDRDFHSRMLLHEPNIIVIDNYLTFYRQHQGNITSKVDDIKTKSLRVSHVHGVAELIRQVDAKGRLTNKLKSHYFDSMMKYLPYVFDNKKEKGVLISLLRRLSYPSFKIAYNWIKFGIANLSFTITGKGSKILR